VLGQFLTLPPCPRTCLHRLIQALPRRKLRWFHVDCVWQSTWSHVREPHLLAGGREGGREREREKFIDNQIEKRHSTGWPLEPVSD
jgi:hypothetical protein